MKKSSLIGAATAVGLSALAVAMPDVQARAGESTLVNPWGTPAYQYYSYPPVPVPVPLTPVPTIAVDPGVRSGAANAGGPMPDIGPNQKVFFVDGREKFSEVEDVPEGLGPRFNGSSCAMCHSQPATGGSSPAINPMLQVATAEGANNALPWFIVRNGPIREARLKRASNGLPDGNVHALFTITGRRDAGRCRIPQFNYLPAGDPLTGLGGNSNVVFRIPTPLFGSGLIEAIPDNVILANMAANREFKDAMGIAGKPNSILSGNVNRDANDGTITRFGWKAQNKSLLIFSAEAYNVEMGITNELFTDEREQDPACLLNATPENLTNFRTYSRTDVLPDIMSFANFMRLLDAPRPAPDTAAIVRGRATFSTIGCAACHTPALTTARLIASNNAADPQQRVNLYSDLLLHNMGAELADGITQGAAGPDEFRTAPLWGLGKRIFFMHDGRTSNLVEAIYYHRSAGSEANRVVDRYSTLTVKEQQEMLYFLRAL